MELTDYALAVSFAEPLARKATAKANKLPPGAIRVLNGVAFRHTQGENTRPRHLYAQKIGPASAVRAFVAQLIKAGLLQRSTGRSWVTLRMTLAGLGVVSQFQRHLREAVKNLVG